MVIYGVIQVDHRFGCDGAGKGQEKGDESGDESGDSHLGRLLEWI